LAVACDNSVSEASYLSDASNSYASPIDPTDGTVVSGTRYSLYTTYSGGAPAVIPGGHYLNYTASSTIASYTMYNSSAALSSTKVFIAYANSNPGSGIGVVATVSTTSAPVYGTPVSFSAVGTNGTHYISAAALDSTHALVAYTRDGLGAARVVTISGTTVSYGTEYSFCTSTSQIKVSKLSSTSVLISFEDYSGTVTSNAIVANISGGVISYGSVYSFTGPNNSGLDSASLDSTHGIVVYQKFSSTGSYGRTLEIAGTSTISYGPEYMIYGGQIFDVSIAPLDSTRALVSYYRASPGTNGVARIANISGTTINFSAEQIFAPDQEISPAAVALDSSHVLLSYSRYANSVWKGVGVVAAVSGNKIYFGSEYQFSSVFNEWYSPAVLSPTHSFISYTYGGYGGSGKGLVAYLGDAPNVPTLISPASGSTGVSVSPNFQFSFTDPNSANAVKFDLQVSTSSDFSSLIINKENYSVGGPWASGSTISYQDPSSLAENVSYYWKARVANSNGWSYWTDPNFFTTGVNQAPNAPSIVSPLNGASGIALSPVLSFLYSDPDGNNCSKFDLQIDNNADFSSPFVSATDYSVGGPWSANSAISYTVPTELASSTTYYWKARVYDGSAWSNWSGGVGLNLANEIDIVSGNTLNCSISDSGNSYCWGCGYPGNNTQSVCVSSPTITPVQVLDVNGSDYLTDVEELDVDISNTCFLKSDDTIYCVGRNNYGALGDNTTTTSLLPVQTLGVGGSGYLTGLKHVSSGNDYSCAVKTDGTVYCWGINGYGKLGNNNTTTQLIPVQVVGAGGSGYLTGVEKVYAAYESTCALKTDGTVWCWGKASFGELGNNDTFASFTPVQVLGPGGSGYLTNVTQMSQSASHSCALKSDGTVYCWGWNGYGAIGNNSTTDALTPVQVLGPGGSGYLTGVAQINAGFYSSCAIKNDNTVWCWGHNNYGQLGNNTTTDSWTPVQVLGVGGSGYLTNVSKVSSGGYHTCAIKDGAVYCWGRGDYGQLGNNTTVTSYTPVQTLKGAAQPGDTDTSWTFTTFSNYPPVLSSVSVDTVNPNICKLSGPETVCQSGSNIIFNSLSSDPDPADQLKLFVCKDSACSNCGISATSGCWAASESFAASDPSAVYNSSSSPACTSEATSNITTTAEYVRSGSYALKTNVGMPDGYANVTFENAEANQQTVYARTYLYIPSDFDWGGAFNIDFLSFGDSDGGDRLDVEMNKNGANINLVYDYWDSYGENHTVEPAYPLSKGSWHYIETKLVVDSANGQVDIWVDGDHPVSDSGLDTGDTNADEFFGGTSWADGPFSSYIYQDDIAFGTAVIGQSPAVGNVFNDGFETNDFSSWDNSSVSRCDTLDTQSDYVNNGNYALKFRVGLNNSQAEIDKNNFVGNKTVYGRVYLYIPEDFDWGSANATNIMGIGDNNGYSRLSLSMENWGTPHLTWTYWDTNDDSHWNDAGDTASVGFVEGSWINIETRVTVDPSNGIVEIWVNGELMVYEDGLNTGNTNGDIFYGASTWADSGFNSYLYEDDIAYGTERIGEAPAQGNIFNDSFETNSLSLWDRVQAGNGSSYCGIGGCFFCQDKEYWGKVCDDKGNCSGIAGEAGEEPEGEGWVKVFGGSDYDRFYSIQQTSDGGYIAVGETGSYGAGDMDAFISKLDSSGNLSWAKTIGGNLYDRFYSIQQTSDGGYIAAGGSESYGAGEGYRDIFISKLDSSGNLSWTKIIGGGLYEDAYSIQQTSDGGYIVGGYTNGYGAGNLDALISKLDSSGNLSWTKTIGGGNEDYINSIQQTSDGGYIVAGATENYGAGGMDIFISKLDSSGNLSWTKTLGGGSFEVGYSAQQTSDGGYIVAGYTYSYGEGYNDALISKLDSSGNLSWTKTLGGDFYEYIDNYSAQQTSDGGYIISVFTNSYGSGYYDTLISKLDSSGNFSWAKTIGGSGLDSAYSIQQTSDGGYIAVGQTDSYGVGGRDAFIAKLDSSGNISSCSACQSALPIVSSVSPSTSSPTPIVSSVSLSTSSPTPSVSSPSLTETTVCPE